MTRFSTAVTKDFDFATDARPDETAELLAGWADSVFRVGEAFGTIGATRDGEIYEITTFRSDVYREESRKPHVEFSDNIETDLSRARLHRQRHGDQAHRGTAPRRWSIPMAAWPIWPRGCCAHRSIPRPRSATTRLRMLRLYRFVATLGFAAD